MVSSLKEQRIRLTGEKVLASRYPGPWLLALIWTLVGAVAYTRHYLQTPSGGSSTQILHDFLLWQTCFYPWIAFAPLVFRLERRFPLLESGQPFNPLWLIGGAVLFVYAGAEVAFFSSWGLDFFFSQGMPLPPIWWKPQTAELWIQFFIYCSTVLGAYVIRSLIRLHQREREATQLALEKSELENSLRQAELETLRMRLNPHFLFNCLQNIAVLTQEDPKTANQMLTRLGDLLRTALRRDGSAEMTLAAEIALTKSYVAIEKMRFEDRLAILFDIDPKSESAMVPAFLLQPLVENAILHGLRGVKRDGAIVIRSKVDSESLLLTISDNGVGLPVKDLASLEHGVGLNSTCKRLQKMYPQQHSFSIRPLPEGGTAVEVILPLRLENPSAGAILYEQPSSVSR